MRRLTSNKCDKQTIDKVKDLYNSVRMPSIRIFDSYWHYLFNTSFKFHLQNSRKFVGNFLRKRDDFIIYFLK